MTKFVHQIQAFTRAVFKLFQSLIFGTTSTICLVAIDHWSFDQASSHLSVMFDVAHVIF